MMQQGGDLLMQQGGVAPQHGGTLLEQLSSGGLALGIGGVPLLGDAMGGAGVGGDLLDSVLPANPAPSTGYSPLADALYSGGSYAPPPTGSLAYAPTAGAGLSAGGSAAAGGLGKGKSMKAMEKEGVRGGPQDEPEHVVKDQFSFIADVRKQQPKPA